MGALQAAVGATNTQRDITPQTPRATAFVLETRALRRPIQPLFLIRGCITWTEISLRRQGPVSVRAIRLETVAVVRCFISIPVLWRGMRTLVIPRMAVRLQSVQVRALVPGN